MARRTKDDDKRPERIEGAPLEYAPVNELGVVFLFAGLAKRLGLTVESVKAGFPDCLAYQRTGTGDNKKRIEFEFKSSNFKAHGHDSRKCDWIVCWEHDWRDVPKNIQVIELRTQFGLGFNVWIMAVGNAYKKKLSKTSLTYWSVPSRASQGDLLLLYRNSPEMWIEDVFRLVGDVRLDVRWKHKYRGRIRRVCRLASPLSFMDMKRHSILRTAGFVRGQMRMGRPRATEFWPYLYDLIIRRNPSVRKALSKYDPARS